MLKNLSIRNFALFDEVNLEINPGMLAFTGETGAGKSLLLGAIGLILGKRLDTAMIFDQKRKCIVEAVFENIPEKTMSRLKNREEFDIDDSRIMIRREADAKGRSRAFINDTPVNLAVLREVTGQLVDLHGQHENQQLMSESHQLRMLDEFAGTEISLHRYRELLDERNKLSTELETLEAKEKTARQQADYLAFQVEELSNAKLDPGSDDSIESELSLLENAETLTQLLGSSAQSLYESDSSIYSKLNSVITSLKGFADMDTGIKDSLERLQEAALAIREASGDMVHLADRIEAEPDRLRLLRERYDLINRLKIKFGTEDVRGLLELLYDFEEQYNSFESISDRIEAARKKLEEVDGKLIEVGLKIEQERKKEIPAMEKAVNSIFSEVGMEAARFQIRMERNAAEFGELEIEGQKIRLGRSGLNKVSYEVQTNPGTPVGPMSKIASGGEISRVMLAVKSAVAGKVSLPVLIFDEIDTGISGEVARKVGGVMNRLAKHYQILTITHLPQIAGQASAHFEVSKSSNEDETKSGIKELSGDERVNALAVMLSGDNPSESALENARELLA